MIASVTEIPWSQLALMVLPVALVIGVLWRWQLNAGMTLYGMARMLVQLLLIGFFLATIFEARTGWIILAVLGVMLMAASWISLRTSSRGRGPLIGPALLSIVIGGGGVLALVTQGVLDLDPWFTPRYVVPLAGMIFASSMNAISLAVERLESELQRGETFTAARGTAYNAALIPITNSLFAVGLVSLPGMMTGQILSGISPFVAARYQIMVMGMLFAAAGISAALFLVLAREQLTRGHSESPSDSTDPAPSTPDMR